MRYLIESLRYFERTLDFIGVYGMDMRLTSHHKYRDLLPMGTSEILYENLHLRVSISAVIGELPNFASSDPVQIQGMNFVITFPEDVPALNGTRSSVAITVFTAKHACLQRFQYVFVDPVAMADGAWNELPVCRCLTYWDPKKRHFRMHFL